MGRNVFGIYAFEVKGPGVEWTASYKRFATWRDAMNAAVEFAAVAHERGLAVAIRVTEIKR